MKKYEITKETILKYQMKDEFPEVFKKELVVGKWYFVERTRFCDPKKALILYDEKDSLCCFDHSGKYTDYYGNPKNDGYIITEAAMQEVETAFINEAKKRGFEKGILVNRTQSMLNDFDSRSSYNDVVIENNEFYFDKEYNSLTIDGRVIFINGKWATIIETITIQEAEKLLNKKIVGL